MPAQISLIERGIATLSPQWALKRARARIALGATERFSNYDGARWDRRTGGWIAGNMDANVAMGPDLVTLRNRSRELLRNNPWAGKMIEDLVSNTVGTGIIPQPRTGSVALDKKISAAWGAFAEECDTGGQMDFYGMQALMMRTLAESGEGLARFRGRLVKDNLTVPLQIQILEADYLDHSRTIGNPGGGYTYYGVQFTPIGQRIAYWLYNHHPGSLLFIGMGTGGGGMLVSNPVPASEVMHIYRTLRPGQIRGVPWLAPVMLSIRDLDDYLDAEQIRKKIEACSVGAITSPEGPNGATLGTTTKDPNSGQNIESFEPGMFYHLKGGQDIRFNDPKASGGFREAVTTFAQRIAAGGNIPYEHMTGDYANVNFSSYRAGTLSYRATIEAYRWLTLVQLFCNPTYRRFIDIAYAAGKIPEPNYGVQWHAPRFESVDPVKDADANKIEVRSGAKTLPQMIAEQGHDPDTQLEEIADTNRKLDKLGIILDTDPRNTTLRGQEQAPGTGEADPDRPPAAAPGKAAKPDNSGPSDPSEPPAPDSGKQSSIARYRSYTQRAYFQRVPEYSGERS